MAREDVELVRAFYEAWMGGEEAKMAAMLDPEIRLNPDPEAFWVGIDEDYVGPEGMARYMAAVNEAFEDYRPEIEEFIDAGEGRVLTLAIEHGRGRESGAEVQSAKTAHLWTVRDGLAVRLDLFLDRDRAFAAVGGEA
jgi:ketosteroid isomerase-like protein